MQKCVVIYKCRMRCDRMEVQKEMVNVDKLRGIMKERRVSVEELAVAIGIDASTLYRRLADGGETFTIKEVNAIVEYLELDIATAMAVFFAAKVA